MKIVKRNKSKNKVKTNSKATVKEGNKLNQEKKTENKIKVKENEGEPV